MDMCLSGTKVFKVPHKGFSFCFFSFSCTNGVLSKYYDRLFLLFSEKCRDTFIKQRHKIMSYFHIIIDEKLTYGKTLRHLLIFKQNIFSQNKWSWKRLGAMTMAFKTASSKKMHYRCLWKLSHLIAKGKIKQ